MALTFAPSVPAGANEPGLGTVPDELPELADGVELIGQYEGSGLQEAPYLIKRRDGQIIQVSRLLFLVASALKQDGRPEVVADYVSQEFGREVSAENVTFLADQKLRPTGLLATPEADAQAPRANPLLALRLRLPLVPERVHHRVTSALMPLFRPIFWAPAVVGIVALDAWLISNLQTGFILATQQLINAPQLLLPLTLLTVMMGCWHEIGHATAARYGGARPGAMGAGIYLIWPVFYTDVTDSYRLDRRGRLRVDLGGIYFNVLFTLVAGAAFLATDSLLLLVFLVVAQTETLRQFLPFVRLDGYYIVSDLAGVPNLFGHARPALARLRPWSPATRHAAGDKALDALTRRARIILTVWACITVPVLLVNIVMLLFLGPRMAGAAWGSAGRQVDALSEAAGAANVLGVANGVIGLVFLVLPAAGITYLTCRMLGHIPPVARRWWGERPVITAVLGSAAAVALAFQVGVAWPRTFTEAARVPVDSSRRSDHVLTGALLHSAGGLAAAGMQAAEAHVPSALPQAPVATPLTPAPPAAPAQPLDAVPDQGDGSDEVVDQPGDQPPGEPAPAPGAGVPGGAPPADPAARPAPAPAPNAPPTTAAGTGTTLPPSPTTTAPSAVTRPLELLLPFLVD